MSKKLNKALGLNDEPETSGQLVPVNNQQFDNANIMENDLEEAKEHIVAARDIAQIAVQDMLDIARQSQHPKAYEALNGILKTYADISKDTITIHEKRQRLTGKKQEDTTEAQVVNQNLFVGSTADLLDMLEQARKKDG